jgi:hypothetical protein
MERGLQPSQAARLVGVHDPGGIREPQCRFRSGAGSGCASASPCASGNAALPNQNSHNTWYNILGAGQYHSGEVIETFANETRYRLYAAEKPLRQGKKHHWRTLTAARKRPRETTSGAEEGHCRHSGANSSNGGFPIPVKPAMDDGAGYAAW